MPKHPELARANVRPLYPYYLLCGRSQWPSRLKDSTPIHLFLHPLIYLSEIAAGYWSLFRSCHRVESKFTLSLLCSAVFSVPFGKNNSRRWERSNKRRLTGRNVRGDAIFPVCTLDRNRKRRITTSLKVKKKQKHPTKNIWFSKHIS